MATSGVEAIGHGFYTDDKSLKQIKAAGDEFGDDGVPIKIEHNAPLLATAGSIKNFRIGPAYTDGKITDGAKTVRGDIHLLKSHPAFEQLCEMSDTMPGCLGLSIEYMGIPEDLGGIDYLRVEKLSNAALVDRGAITPNGLLSGKEPYGDVEYADPGYQSDKKKRYPIDTEEHARAAWSYINKASNAREYTADQLAHIKGKIKRALKGFGVKVSDEMAALVDLETFLKADESENKNFMNPLKEITDILAARKTFVAADEIINPALAKAGVLQISVDGQPKPTEDAPLAARLTAFVGLLTAPEGKQREAELLATNAIIAGEADTAKKNLAIATATVSGLQSEKSQLAAKVTSLETAVATMTAEKATMGVQLKAAMDEFARVNGINLGLNSEISRQALKFGCLSDLKDKDGKLIASTASSAEREAAADLISAKDKLTALGGAVTAALQRAGVPAGSSPAQPVAGSESKAPKLTRAEFFKLEPKEQTKFFDMKGTFID